MSVGHCASIPERQVGCSGATWAVRRDGSASALMPSGKNEVCPKLHMSVACPEPVSGTRFLRDGNGSGSADASDDLPSGNMHWWPRKPTLHCLGFSMTASSRAAAVRRFARERHSRHISYGPAFCIDEGEGGSRAVRMKKAVLVARSIKRAERVSQHRRRSINALPGRQGRQRWH